MKREIGRFYDTIEIFYKMSEFRDLMFDLDGASIKFQADIFDPVWIDDALGYSISKVMKQKVCSF